MNCFLKYSFFLLCVTSLFPEDISKYIKKAGEKLLWEEDKWRLLLYYKKCGIGSYCSLVKSTDFFYSAEGDKNPSAELLATLRNFYKKPIPEKPNEHAQCKFPARLNWLRSKLDLTSLPQLKCKKLSQFKEKMKARTLSLVYASPDFNQPAAIFGHTFLKFNKEVKENYKDQTVSFFALPAQDNILFHIYKGLTGGYKAMYKIAPFSDTRATYNILENRNLWELQLSFTEKEINFLIDHLWEVHSVVYKYYFIDENCAYYNIYLLDIIRESLGLSSDRIYSVQPMDTIKNLLARDGLFTEAIYHPSSGQIYKHIYLKLMTDPEKQVFIDFMKSGELDLKNTPPRIRKELVFSACLQYLLMNTNLMGMKTQRAKYIRSLKKLLQLQKEKNINVYNYAEAGFHKPIS